MADGILTPPLPWTTAYGLASDGADLLDLGGESTPYSTAVSTEEELRRVIPVVAAICRQTAVPVSINTSKAVVAREAIGAGPRSSTT